MRFASHGGTCCAAFDIEKVSSMNRPRIVLAGVPESLIEPLGAGFPMAEVVWAPTAWDLLLEIAGGRAAVLVLGQRICGVPMDAVLREAYVGRNLSPVPTIAIRDDAGSMGSAREIQQEMGRSFVLPYPGPAEEIVRLLHVLMTDGARGSEAGLHR